MGTFHEKEPLLGTLSAMILTAFVSTFLMLNCAVSGMGPIALQVMT